MATQLLLHVSLHFWCLHQNETACWPSGHNSATWGDPLVLCVCSPTSVPHTHTIKKAVLYWQRLDWVPFLRFCSWQPRLSRLQGFKLQIMDVQYFWRRVVRSESLYVRPLIVPLLMASPTLHFYVLSLLCQEKRWATQSIARWTTVRAVSTTTVDCSFLIVHIKEEKWFPYQIQTFRLHCNVVVRSCECILVIYVDLWPAWPHQALSLHLLLI